MKSTRPCLATGAAHSPGLLALKLALRRTQPLHTHVHACRPDLAAGENKLPTEFMYGNASFPKAVDWRKKGAVTPVKNQQQVQLHPAHVNLALCTGPTLSAAAGVGLTWFTCGCPVLSLHVV